METSQEQKAILLRMPLELWQKIQAQARVEDRSGAAQMRHVLSRSVQDERRGATSNGA